MQKRRRLGAIIDREPKPCCADVFPISKQAVSRHNLHTLCRRWPDVRVCYLGQSRCIYTLVLNACTLVRAGFTFFFFFTWNYANKYSPRAHQHQRQFPRWDLFLSKSTSFGKLKSKHSTRCSGCSIASWMCIYLLLRKRKKPVHTDCQL